MSEAFIAAQARAWSEIREWMQEAEGHQLIETRPGGSWDGPGASLDETADLRRRLPDLLANLGVTSVLDAACGDWNWMRLVDLSGISYTGWDVDPGRIERCRQRDALGDVTGDPVALDFETVNLLTVDEVPYFDLILCRDFLGHLPNDLITSVLLKFRDSGSQWLLATTYPDSDNDFTYDPARYAWDGYMERPVNLERGPWELRRVDAIPETRGPGGVLTLERDLALFHLEAHG